MGRPAGTICTMAERKVMLLKIVAKSIKKHGYQPSYRELAEKFGYNSLGYIYVVVRSLQEDGVVRCHGARAMEFDWQKYL